MIRFFNVQCGLMYSSITAWHAYPIVSLIRDTVERGRLTPGAPEVRCKSALSVGEASSLRNGSSQDLPLHFHCSLIQSLLRPNQQVCSRLVSGFLPYPQGLWNGGQWVCYCFSLALYPHIALWCQQWNDWASWSVEEKKKKPREEITAIMISVRVYSQQGCNCSSGHGRIPIWRRERGKYHLSPNRLKWNSSSWQRAAENIEFSLKFITKHNPYCLSDGVQYTVQWNYFTCKQYCQMWHL